MNTYTKDSLIRKLNLPIEITNNIQEYVFSETYFLNCWKNKIAETLSIIDQGYKIVNIFAINRNDNVFGNPDEDYDSEYVKCPECYLRAFSKNRSYNDDECNVCLTLSRKGYLWLGYCIKSYNDFKYSREFNHYLKQSLYIKSLILSSKYQAENNITHAPYFASKKHISGLLYEINHGPIQWNKKLAYKKILFKRFNKSYMSWFLSLPRSEW